MRDKNVPIEVLEFAWRKYGSRLIRAVHRYPGFTVVARSRDRLKLGQRVAESLYNGLAVLDTPLSNNRGRRLAD